MPVKFIYDHVVMVGKLMLIENGYYTIETRHGTFKLKFSEVEFI